MGLTFPHAGMMTRQWAPESLPQPLVEDRTIYRRALDAVRKVPTPSRPEGRAYVHDRTARLEFAVQYFDAIDSVKKSSEAPGRTCALSTSLGLAKFRATNLLSRFAVRGRKAGGNWIRRRW